MPITAKYLSKIFGKDFSKLIEETNEFLQPLGLQIYKHDKEFHLQFDLSKLYRSSKGKLLYLLMTSPLEGTDAIEDSWEYSSLTRNEKATLMAAIACSKKFHSDTFGIDNLKAILMPNADKSLMTLGQFKNVISSLKRKHYLKTGSGKDMLKIGWRLNTELTIIEKENPDEIEDLVETI